MVDEAPCGCLLPRYKEMVCSMRKLIITVALTGGQHNKLVNPSLPEQPYEIAEAAYQSFNEGAAIVHIHARDKNGKPTGDPDVFTEIHSLIRYRCNVVLQDSTGGGANLSLEEKIACVKAKPEMASLNMGTMLRTIGPRAGTAFINARSDIEYFVEKMLKYNVKPEMEVYHHGMLREVHHLISKGLVEKPYYVNFVLGMAYQGAVDGTAENLITLKSLLPPDSIFNVTAIGAAQLPMTTLSMLLGGMVRVGLEDNIYLKKGVLAESNAQLVSRTIRIARELGFEIASPDDAREILGLSPIY